MGGCVSYVKRRVRRRLRPGEEAEHQYLGQNFDDGIALEQGGGALAGHQNQQTIGTRPGAGLVTRSATLTSRLTAANNMNNRNSQNTNPNQFKSVDELVSSGIKEAQLAIEMSGRGKRKQAAKHQQKARELLQLALVKGQNPHLKFHLQAVLQKLGVVDLEWASISNYATLQKCRSTYRPGFHQLPHFLQMPFFSFRTLSLNIWRKFVYAISPSIAIPVLQCIRTNRTP